MDLTYITTENIPSPEIMDAIQRLHNSIFGGNDNLLAKMDGKPKLLFNLALDGQKVVGYKIGYELDQTKFYSWLGGVHPAYRNHGIASTLMHQQHNYLKQNGYTSVQTKTMNKWHGMLILNIKSGFNIVETYTDKNARHKVILEKNLQDG
ncbi:GNAT family N-acetyltransferase [Neobacillus sp. YIM B06451]|uniref:GNAT family N-acetyltransferase n=1 Tax=Neobacillus sp. YIM B06451 TaxID=3070994 RepID=UPI00292E5021|nr:GNAT family N-acetyltransferase [Neobacillus sp. YIM B06451]